ncbi:anthranilate synthase component I family protein [Alicyclobacillaceae bacterium I2511]|nr:anthranilate synthase component I family protein [Alicyclobacillaceae bacterium I2511]
MKKTTWTIQNGVDPFALFLRLVEEFGEGQVFLLDAAEDHSESHYCMSLLAVLPVVEVQVKDHWVSLFAPSGMLEKLGVAVLKNSEENCAAGNAPEPSSSVVGPVQGQRFENNPMDFLEGLRTRVRELFTDPVWAPFSAGWLGYVGYDSVHYLERLPKTTQDDRQLPDIRLQWHAAVLQLVEGKLSLFDSSEELGSLLDPDVWIAVKNQVNKVADTVKRFIQRPMTATALLARYEEQIPAVTGDVRQCMESSDTQDLLTDEVTQQEYELAVNKAVSYIHAGDIFQVVLSKRIRVRKVCNAYEAYERLRRRNPSPYMFVADYPDMRLFGASPEVQFRSVNGIAEMRPIAGTSKGRGRTLAEDELLRAALLHDEKERAEHVMLVDLCRNDLGRVCKIGSVQVQSLMQVEPYSHLFHLVSEVSGQLRPEVSVFDALLATFPAGTLSGAPKIRAMEIIDELETLRRGPYGGLIGMVDFAANANTAIVIRTVLEWKHEYYVQVGAGIVADSQPVQEWQECNHKAGAVLEVLQALSTVVQG